MAEGLRRASESGAFLGPGCGMRSTGFSECHNELAKFRKVAYVNGGLILTRLVLRTKALHVPVGQQAKDRSFGLLLHREKTCYRKCDERKFDMIFKKNRMNNERERPGGCKRSCQRSYDS